MFIIVIDYYLCNFSLSFKHLTVIVMVDSADKCVYQKCAIGSTFVPRLSGKFFATENFFYTSQVNRMCREAGNVYK